MVRNPLSVLSEVLHGVFATKAKAFADLPSVPRAAKQDLTDAFGPHVVPMAPVRGDCLLEYSLRWNALLMRDFRYSQRV